MNQEIILNPSDVIESLAEQNKQQNISIAYNAAIIKAKDEKIKELEKDLEQLRKELIEKMDGEAGKEKK